MSDVLYQLLIAPYREEHAAATLSLFVAAVTQTAAADYTPAQIQAWARPAERDLVSWHHAMSTRNSFVALLHGEVVGFSDVSAVGYIDMLFVSPTFQRQGVGACLLAEAERQAREAAAARLQANVSLTARALFEHHGFRVDQVQHPSLAGVILMNFRMSKPLI